MKLFNHSKAKVSNGKRRNLKRGLRIEALEIRQLLAADITGTIYDDVDANGIKSAPDNTLGGWTAFVDIDQNGVLNNLPDGSSEPFAVANAGGDYKINMVGRPSGIYRVAEVVQPGWIPTAPTSRDVMFTAGQSVDKIDFFNFAGGTIEGTIWNDLNQDGIRDITDPGLVGWTIFLDINTNGSLDATEPFTVTDSEGFYRFTDVPPADYEVTEILPVGWDTDFDIKQTAEVQALQTVTLDFVNFSAINGAITGTVWNDQNRDGDRAFDLETGLPIEPGLEGWTVFIDDNNNGFLDVTEMSTATDTLGNYIFPSVISGSHRVREILPSSEWSLAPGYSVQQIVNVNANETTSDVDFANFTVLNGAIRGTVWNDVNRDGVRNIVLGAYVEPGLQGWTIFLDMNHSGALDAGEPTALTTADGTYLFSDLQIGEYNLIEVVPSGWETAPGYGDNHTVQVYSGATSIAPDFANFNLSTLVLGTVSGLVWDDMNGNGLRDVSPITEPGSADWTVYVDVNGDRVANPTEPTAVTAANGTFTISGVTPGSITIVIQPRSGWHATSPISGTRSLTLKNGENVSNINFGEQQVRDSAISGTVFADSNKNGIRDTIEKGLAGIVVYLDTNGNEALDLDEPSTVSSADQFFTPSVNEAGTYSFTHLAAGNYNVRQVLPPRLSATPSSELVHAVSVLGGQSLTGVDFADVYRPNEIHGIKFNDANANGVRDAGETGIAGTTVFIDLNRNNSWDPGEPITLTAIDGSYAFLDLSPGAYVVRTVLENGHTGTSPTTIGGDLWPDGVSNLAVGNVTPLSITRSLENGEHFSQNVTITLPGSGGLTNLVDVFLLFDDTGSFTYNSPIVRSAFPLIMAQLQSLLPGIDLGFGVGRFEEYANFAAEYSTGRPFILNQPIVRSSTPGYEAAIQSALDRTAPGYGGDEPETDIEALYQLVTGLGFDGNNNGSVLDSGAAGLSSTQLSPGNSGDVPPFASFTVDTASGALPAAGTIGGGGFRAGALPVILLATDTGFAYQPKGETSITGLGGLTLPISDLTETSRATTPFGSGAGFQETITGLNALGALVIGLGTNPQANLDPRQALEALAKLTGAINQSTTTIANGTVDPIAPGDPFYFQIASGFAGSVSAGVVNAIQNAVTNVAVNITVRASDPRVNIINHTGTLNGLTAGQTAAFYIEYIGDGVPHRFDLQFVREGTDVVLGSIPVVLGTPIPGDGYHFDDLYDGEIELEDDFGDSENFAEVSGAFVYYHGTSFDTGSLSNALDTSKQLAKEGIAPQTLSYDNLINSNRGINGLVFDIENLPGSLSVNDFKFQMSPQGAFIEGDNLPVDWASAPAPSSVTVVPGSPNRVVIEWPDVAIVNRWLRITIKANDDTGLAAPEVYYIGHLLGETTGQLGGIYTVSFADIRAIRHEVSQIVNATSIVDLDKNGTVAFADISAMRSTVSTQLTNISIPAASQGQGGGAGQMMSTSTGNDKDKGYLSTLPKRSSGNVPAVISPNLLSKHDLRGDSDKSTASRFSTYGEELPGQLVRRSREMSHRKLEIQPTWFETFTGTQASPATRLKSSLVSRDLQSLSSKEWLTDVDQFFGSFELP
ncbi:MAG: hypothetical protein KF752_00625 [Pirellulaceae bacterium]|nr:hypothetical protein [Pirellulaceae bacterium]